MCFQKQFVESIILHLTISLHTGIHTFAWETALEGTMNSVKSLILHLTTSPHTGIRTFVWEIGFEGGGVK